ncbi:MAG TPA: hypothetical protein VGJ04_02315, partial [Pirellulales bacterium]
YLNFGLPGVLIGGALLGWIWSWLFSGARRLERYHSAAARLFFSFAALSFSGYLPTLVRAGPEVYKGAIIDAFLVPFAVLWFAQEQKSPKHSYGRNPAIHKPEFINTQTLPHLIWRSIT